MRRLRLSMAAHPAVCDWQAVERERPRLVQLLLAKGANVDACDATNNTPLHLAIKAKVLFLPCPACHHSDMQLCTALVHKKIGIPIVLCQ